MQAIALLAYCVAPVTVIALVVMFIRKHLRKTEKSMQSISESLNRITNIERVDDDITSYKTTIDIFQSGKFTPEERRAEYRRRGKSPSGVIDGIYNDMYLENGASYNDMDRDWDADA